MVGLHGGDFERGEGGGRHRETQERTCHWTRRREGGLLKRAKRKTEKKNRQRKTDKQRKRKKVKRNKRTKEQKKKKKRTCQ